MESKENIERLLYKAGFKSLNFEAYELRKDLEDLFLYSGKHKPELCLNMQFRAGISVLAHLVSDEEYKRGIDKLRQDIESKKIDKAVRSYKHDKGDYMFIIATK